MMNHSTTAIYEFLEGAPDLEHVRIDVASPAFAAFRRNIRRLVEIVREDQASIADADRLQYSLLQWLSVPLPIAYFDLSPIFSPGTHEAFAARWGEDARRCLHEAEIALEELRSSENPLRLAVQEALLREAATSGSIRIYCHRTARGHFESLEHWNDITELATVDFLGSPRDYRASVLFDTLLKVGPLRTRGFSSMPGAVYNAPRFRKLVQVTWFGSPNETGFGDDPVLERIAAKTGEPPGGEDQSQKPHFVRSVACTTVVVGDTRPRSAADLAIVDDFDAERMSRSARNATLRKAMLFHLADELGCLQAPRADIMCLYREGANVVATRVEPSDIDYRFTHLVDPELQQVDFGILQATHGRYAPQWKARLQDEYRRDPAALAERLRHGGIDLVNIEARIREWIQPSGTVIPSPQQRRHFEILIGVLGIEGDPVSYPRGRRLTWSACAWAEISQSRGVAIRHGTEGNEIIVEQLEILLNRNQLQFADQVEPGVSFTWEIPSGQSLTGSIRLHAINEIEGGYRCPEQILKTIEAIENLVIWRE
jgi:hypothetical protein